MKYLHIIPTRFHGILDYVLAVTIISMPNIVGFDHMKGPIVLVPFAVGSIIGIINLLTKHEVGIFKLIPMPLHLFVDFICGVVLMATPFYFKLTDYTPHIWAPHIILGGVQILVALITMTRPAPVIQISVTTSHTPQEISDIASI